MIVPVTKTVSGSLYIATEAYSTGLLFDESISFPLIENVFCPKEVTQKWNNNTITNIFLTIYLY